MRVVSDWLIGRAGPRPGQVVLELAAGPGGLGHRVARTVGVNGRVISTDFAPEMVEAARRLGAQRGVDNAEYRTLDAERMELDDDSVDAVLCRSGFMLMADPLAALRESRRVLRSGGALAFSVFTTAEENPHVSVPVRTFVARGHMPPPAPGPPGIFSMGDPARIRDLVTSASFADPEIEAIEFAFRYTDEDDAWDTIVEINGRLAPVITALDEEARRDIRRSVIEGFAPYRDADGSYLVPARAWAVLAR